jgi:hypothetical protein
MNSVITGRYMHYKGGEYYVESTIKNATTGEEMVLYHALYGERERSVRTIKDFTEVIISSTNLSQNGSKNEYPVEKRFKYIGPV